MATQENHPHANYCRICRDGTTAVFFKALQVSPPVCTQGQEPLVCTVLFYSFNLEYEYGNSGNKNETI